MALLSVLPVALLSLASSAAAQSAPAVAAAPASFQANPTAGGGKGNFKESPRFRVYSVASADRATTALNLLESAYTCFVEDLGWRSSGLSLNAKDDKGPYMKLNAYAVGSPAEIGGAAGVMSGDAGTGHAFLKVIQSSVTEPRVIVHEYGHALTYYERSWVDQQRTGAWWEAMANFVADTWMTSPLCANARKKYNQPEGRTVIDLNKVLGAAHQVILDGSQGTGNYYEAWPLFAYMTNNPDSIPELGKFGVRDLFRKYAARSNETPLHALDRVVSPGTTAQKVVAKYWARMAFVDIGHKQAETQFASIRNRIDYANLDSTGSGTWKVKTARAPKYMGANIIPLKNIAGGEVSVKVTADAPFTAMMAVKAKGAAGTYTELVGGTGAVKVPAGSEASLVVVNTPVKLVLFDGFKIPGSEAAKTLSYQVQITGATA